MKKWRIYVKGSTAENGWLNALAKHGWQLDSIHGFQYQFKKSEPGWHTFSEYVKSGPVDLSATSGDFRALTQYHIKKPDLWAVYTATNNSQFLQAAKDADTDHIQLSIDRVTRTRIMNICNAFILVFFGIAVIFGTLGLVASDNNDALSALSFHFMVSGIVLMAFSWAVMMLLSSVVQRRIQRLVKATGDYDGTWLPTWHVMLEKAPRGLDTDSLKYVGRWIPLVQDDRRKLYYYDLQTNASQKAIQDAIDGDLKDPNVKVSIISWLGLGGWFI